MWQILHHSGTNTQSTYTSTYHNSGNFHCHVIFVAAKKRLKIEMHFFRSKKKTTKITNTKKNLMKIS